MSLMSPTLADGFFTTNAIWEAPTKLLTFCQTELKDFFSFVTFHRVGGTRENITEQIGFELSLAG